MFYIIASLYTKRNAAKWIATKKATCDTYTPLIAGTFMLKASVLLTIMFAMWTFKEHRTSFSKETRHANKLALLLGY